LEKSKVAIILPIFNEEKTIKKLLINLKKIGSLIVVDDCSNDSTQTILKNFNFKIIKNSKNLGYEKSLKKGLVYAVRKNFKYIVTVDGDGEHYISDVKKVLRRLKYYDLVYTSRKSIFRISEKIVKFFFSKIFKIEDPLSGLKGYKINLLKKYDFKNWSGTYGSDILIFARLKNYTISKINININKRKDNSRIGDNFFVNLSILRLLFIIFSKYKSKN
tara:strand:- start:1587 stop:2240 length:654 start_codon:yes stop_codon:yes gene_type:complete